MDSMVMWGRRAARIAGIRVQQALGARVFAVFADEIQQLDVGLAALAQRRFTQGQALTFVLHGLQQPLMDGAEVFGALLRLVQAQVQIRQVVMGDDAGRHRFVGIRPAFEQHLRQGQGLQVSLTGVDQFAQHEAAIGPFDRAFPVLHGEPPKRLRGLHAAGGEFLGVEQLFQLAARQVGVFQGDVDHRAAFLVGLLGDFGGFLVTDDRVERGDQNRVARQRFFEARLVDLEAGDGFVAEQAAGVGQQFDAAQQVLRDDRQHHVQFEIARLAGDGDHRIVADHLRGDHGGGFRDHRIDLARHDRRARLQGFQFDFAEAGQRAGVHPAQVVGDFHQRHSGGFELAGDGDGGVLRADQREQILARGELHVGQLAQLTTETRGELRMCVDPGADRRAALRQGLQAWQQILQMTRCWP